MPRLDQNRQQELEPKRIASCKNKLIELGFEITYEDHTRIEFNFKESKVSLWPYSGWHTGKTIKDGRGFEKLLKQLKN